MGHQSNRGMTASSLSRRSLLVSSAAVGAMAGLGVAPWATRQARAAIPGR